MVVMRPSRLLTHPDLAPYVRPSEGSAGGSADGGGSNLNVGEGLDVEAMILQNEDFRIALDDIGLAIDSAFQVSQKKTQAFLPLKASYLKNRVALLDMGYTDNGDAIIAGPAGATQGLRVASVTTAAAQNAEGHGRHDAAARPVYSAKYTAVMDRFAEHDDGDFLALLETYTEQRAQFEAIVAFVDVGLMRVDLKDFRAMLIPSPTRLLEAFHALIPAIAGRKIQGLLDEVNEMNDVLSVPPREVGAFVKVVQVFRKADAGMYELDSLVSEANALVFLMEQRRIPLTPALNTNHFLLMQTGNALKTSMTKVEESMEAQKRKFAKQLKVEVPLLRDEIYEVRASLEHSMISDPSCSPNTVSDYLQSVEDILTDHATQAREYQRYQRAMDLDVTTFDELDEVQADLGVKQRLWGGLAGWNRLTSIWCESQLEQLEVEEMESEIASYFRTAAVCRRKLVGNPVAELLRKTVGDFKTTLPIVSCLRAPGLKQRHWDAIHKIAGFHIEGERMTMRELMARGVTDKVERIEIVATEAINESVLQQMLAKVALDWKEMEFELKPYKEIKNCEWHASRAHHGLSFRPRCFSLSLSLSHVWCSVFPDSRPWVSFIVFFILFPPHQAGSSVLWTTCSSCWMTPS